MDKNERYSQSGSNKIVSVTHYWVNANAERAGRGDFNSGASGREQR